MFICRGGGIIGGRTSRNVLSVERRKERKAMKSRKKGDLERVIVQNRKKNQISAKELNSLGKILTLIIRESIDRT